jgi:hypothetical protein
MDRSSFPDPGIHSETSIDYRTTDVKVIRPLLTPERLKTENSNQAQFYEQKVTNDMRTSRFETRYNAIPSERDILWLSYKWCNMARNEKINIAIV